MSFVSTGVEYGLHCLLHLVPLDERQEGAGVRDLAELQGVSGEFLAKVFTKLAKGGIVAATEGVRGGFRLARPADEITVHDVVVAIDGEKALFDCREIRGRSALFDGEAPVWATRGVCAIHAVMQQAEKAMRQELMQHTLAELAQRATKKAPASAGKQVVAWLSAKTAGRRADISAGEPSED